MTNKKRYAIVMLIGFIMNQCFYAICEGLNLPMWLDICGTAFVAMTLEPTAGLLVGLAGNFLLALEIGDSSSLVYYSVSAAAALIVGLNIVKDGRIDPKRILATAVLAFTVTTLLAAGLTLWRNGGYPTGNWESYFCNSAIAAGFPRILGCLYGTAVVKFFDTIFTVFIVSIAYRVLPNVLKYPPAKAEKTKA